MRLNQTPTKGEKIDITTRSNKALLVIDLQDDFTSNFETDKYTPSYLKGRLDQVNTLSVEYNDAQHSVITIRHIFNGWYINLLMKILAGGKGCENSNGLGLDNRLKIKSDFEMIKSAGDAFSNPDLLEYLAKKNIGTLLISGLDGNYCVKNTSLGALNRGYKVEIYDNAVLSTSDTQWAKDKELLIRQGATIIE
ncbi:isochorismatase family protein [Pseudemcibacter aquimaris]|uniref:isochorismatase family protein n=1 Tax=Pseudemcibacter aquimaris TaxID=2857064 RepID=UPI002011DAA1|nr:isochorismatase family protein [Pseudemcibacter aquimaris]MCC3860078.1 cysteine hydrolase [Pseudemcibacter aquimaris]WDU57407.1 cysteine hydrolase [Pseudemcibacter aquimaris]